MQAEPEDRPRYREPSKFKSVALVLVAFALVGLVVWHTLLPQDRPLTLTKKELPQPEAKPPAPPKTAKMPWESETNTLPKVKPAPAVELPALDDSDPTVKAEIKQLSPETGLLRWLKNDFLIRRGVAIIDALRNGAIATKLLNLPSPKDRFVADKSAGALWLDSANYDRYGRFMAVIEKIDPVAAANLYLRFKPLLQEAYGELGYPGNKLDDTLLGAIEQITSAPTISTPIELKQESVAYTFADPKLEKLPPVQKTLIRMGPENTRIIQQKAEQLRQALLAGNSAPAEG